MPINNSTASCQWAPSCTGRIVQLYVIDWSGINVDFEYGKYQGGIQCGYIPTADILVVSHTYCELQMLTMYPFSIAVVVLLMISSYSLLHSDSCLSYIMVGRSQIRALQKSSWEDTVRRVQCGYSIAWRTITQNQWVSNLPTQQSRSAFVEIVTLCCLVHFFIVTASIAQPGK